MIEALLTGAVRAGTSVLYGSIGELVGERSGVINLGVEGSMIMGAFAGFAVTADTGSAALGILAALLAGGLAGLIHAFLVVTMGANQLASGLAVMFFGLGITAYFGQDYVTKQIQGLQVIPIPYLSDIPFLGPILFNHDVLTYAAYVIGPLVGVFLFKTRWGILLRAVGEREEVVYAMGHSPRLIRYLGVTAGGMLAGLGGAQLSMAFTMAWVENMTAGRGIIAVALVIFASWKPVRAMLGAYLFGGAQALQLILQARGYAVSPFILLMTPYLLTLFVLFLVERRKQGIGAMPEALRRVAERRGAVQT